MQSNIIILYMLCKVQHIANNISHETLPHSYHITLRFLWMVPNIDGRILSKIKSVNKSNLHKVDYRTTCQTCKPF